MALPLSPSWVPPLLGSLGPGAPRPCPARRARRRPRGPQEAPRPPAPPAAPSAQRPRQALPGSERGRPRAAAGAAGTCSSPGPASAVAIAAPAPRASLCPGPATWPRGRAFVCAARRPRCPRRGLSCSATLSAPLRPSAPLPLSVCPFIPLLVCFPPFQSLPLFLSPFLPLSLCLCLVCFPLSPLVSASRPCL